MSWVLQESFSWLLKLLLLLNKNSRLDAINRLKYHKINIF